MAQYDVTLNIYGKPAEKTEQLVYQYMNKNPEVTNFDEALKNVVWKMYKNHLDFITCEFIKDKTIIEVEDKEGERNYNILHNKVNSDFTISATINKNKTLLVQSSVENIETQLIQMTDKEYDEFISYLNSKKE